LNKNKKKGRGRPIDVRKFLIHLDPAIYTYLALSGSTALSEDS
jgi:hypothetical protein